MKENSFIKLFFSLINTLFFHICHSFVLPSCIVSVIILVVVISPLLVIVVIPFVRVLFVEVSECVRIYFILMLSLLMSHLSRPVLFGCDCIGHIIKKVGFFVLWSLRFLLGTLIFLELSDFSHHIIKIE